MKINQVTISHCQFKAEPIKKENYKQIAEKRAYVDAKTNKLEDLALLSFLGALMSGVYDSKFTEKNQKPGKLCIGFVAASAILLVTKWIKQIQLAAQYDKEVQK